jgi:hypothetical protein
LLLQSTDAGIIDRSQTVQQVKLNGNTKSSTTQYKFLSSSMYFDGSGDFVSTESSSITAFGTGDFTIEAWIRWSSMASESAIIYANGTGWVVYMYPANKIQWGTTSPQTPANKLTSSTSLSTNTWYHLAVVRNSGTVTIYIDGTADGNVSDTNNYSVSGSLEIGKSHSSQYFSGFMSDVRITKGFARYTGNFTAPTTALTG